MTKLVVFNFDNGNFNEGFHVTLTVKESDKEIVETKGKFPSYSQDIFQLYEQWRSAYQNLKETKRAKLGTSKIGDTQDTIKHCQKQAEYLKYALKDWLKSEHREFQNIVQSLSQALGNERGEIRVLIKAEDSRLKKLPWQEWDLFADIYTHAEIAFSPVNFRSITPRETPNREGVRILAIFGDDSELNLHRDLAEINSLSGTNPVFIEILEKPEPEEFYQRLRAEPGWDILFFAGHSSSEDNFQNGLHISKNKVLKIEQFKKALNKAIREGLQLVILNSCDGLGLAEEMALLNLPQIIVMREQIPDIAAQRFIKSFLSNFAGGKSLYAAVWEAKESLEWLESECPGITWLPVICQNPSVPPIVWSQFLPEIEEVVSTEVLFDNYLNNTIQRLKENGCVNVEKDVEFSGGNILDCVAKIANLSLPFGIFDMRGDAFFCFSSFDFINLESLREFSLLCLEYAKTQSTSSVVGQILDARVPAKLSFAVAMVSSLDETTKQIVKTSNPMDYKTDLLWCHAPVIYAADENQLCYYDSPQFWDKFKGEVIWEKLRIIIQQLLTP
jgi:hypothetical protein